MSKICYMCDKKPRSGRSYARRGMAKKKGGAGRKITGKTLRLFLPNLKRIRALVKGKTETVWVCTKCLKSGKVRKSVKYGVRP